MYDNLKNDLVTVEYLDIANATYCQGSIAFGDLQAIGAGFIERYRDINGNLEYYGFHYNTQLNGKKITAVLRFGNNLLRPGETYESHY